MACGNEIRGCEHNHFVYLNFSESSLIYVHEGVAKVELSQSILRLGMENDFHFTTDELLLC